MTDDERGLLAAEQFTERALKNQLAQAETGPANRYCADCDEEIEEKRRQAFPGVKLCYECKRIEEIREKQGLS